MSHQVLARKYRPRSFEEMRGQEHVVQALSNALTQGRLHHAYLFTGTRGVGKTTVSRLLAKCLNCTGADGQGGVTATPCGACPACRDIDAGRFVDYVELDAASNRGVDEISLLLDQAVYKPVVGRFKVYMIDEVHMLSTTAFNAMLKTLEEPPDYLKFVLATTDPQKVPPTVLSRCLQFNLRPMAPATVQEHLAHVLNAESIEAEPGALRLLARAARGSMRDALSLTDQAIAYGAGVLSESGVREMLGAVDSAHAVGVVQALAASDGAALVAAVDRLREHGLSAAGTLDELAQLLQNIALVKAVPGALDAADPDAAAAEKLAPLLEADELQLAYSVALHGRAELALAPDEYSGLTMILLRLLAFRPRDARVADRPASGVPVAGGGSTGARSAALARTPATAVAVAVAHPHPGPLPRRGEGENGVVSRPAGGGRGESGQRAPASSQEPPPWLDVPPEADDRPVASVPIKPGAAEQAVAPIERTAVGDRWQAVVQQLIDANRITALARELAVQSECVSASDDNTRWVLRVERESLRAPAQCDKLQTALATTLNAAVELQVDLGPACDTPARRASEDRERRQREAERALREDPMVQALMAQYKTARIVPGSVKPR